MVQYSWWVTVDAEWAAVNVYLPRAVWYPRQRDRRVRARWLNVLGNFKGIDVGHPMREFRDVLSVNILKCGDVGVWIFSMTVERQSWLTRWAGRVSVYEFLGIRPFIDIADERWTAHTALSPDLGSWAKSAIQLCKRSVCIYITSPITGIQQFWAVRVAFLRRYNLEWCSKEVANVS